MIKCKRLTFLLFIIFYYSDKSFLNQAFLTKSIDLLLYLSIIISEEREINKRFIQGMKEMKENLIYKRMLCDVVDNGFWEIQRIRRCFRYELLYSDFMDYTNDNMEDSNVLLKELYETKGDYVTAELTRKVSLYYKSKEELIRDIRYYLLENYDIVYNNELEKRMNNEKKEGK